MDIEIPGMSGIEAVKILKEKHPEVKILMETIFEDKNKFFNPFVPDGSTKLCSKQFTTCFE